MPLAVQRPFHSAAAALAATVRFNVIRILLYAVVIYLLLGIRIVKSEEWMVVMRSGKYRGFRKQGIHWVIPFVDETVRVDLAQVTADWKNTPEEVLETAVHKWVLTRSAS